MRATRLTSPLLALTLAVAGCNLHPGTTKAPLKVSASAAPVLPGSGVAALTGKVKLLVDATLLSDHGAGVISNNTGNLLSDHGAGIISNHAAGRRLLSTAPPAEALLAEAVITVEDLDGKPLKGADGKPLTATTDATGSYSLEADLGQHNAVLRIKLWNGGELRAMASKGSQTIAIDTASSIGAAYVLGRYVHGDQATFDKLPATQADRLHAELTSAQGLVTRAPVYQPDDLALLGETLRDEAPAVDQSLKDIQALLLGQARLGNGLQATAVPLYQPHGLALTPDGHLLFGEPGLGRIRDVAPDGTLQTLADTVRGKVKRNFARLADLVRADDGTIYVATDRFVFAIAPDGTVKPLMGNAAATVDTSIPPGPGTAVRPSCLALGPDGTLYVGEAGDDGSTRTPRLLAIRGGEVTALPFDATHFKSIQGIAAAPDGTLTVYAYQPLDQGTLFHFDGQHQQALVSGLGVGEGLARGVDGTTYLSVHGESGGAKQVLAIAPDNTRQVLSGTETLQQPGALHLAADGTLYLVDQATNLIYARSPQGTLTLRAGVSNADVSQDPGSLGFDSPTGAVYDARGRLLVTEEASHRVVAFDGQRVTTIAGTSEGYSGDGGPATQARLTAPVGIARRGDTLYVVTNGRIRAIDAGGTITTVVGSDDYPAKTELQAGERVAPAHVNASGDGLAIGADGSLYFDNDHGQVLRLAPDNMVTLVAGAPHVNSLDEQAGGVAGVLAQLKDYSGPGAGLPMISPTGLAVDAAGNLYVADSAGQRVYKITDPAGTPMVVPFAGLPFTDTIGVLGAAPPDDNGKPATQAVLAGPAGLAVDADGNVWLGELGTVAISLFVSVTGSQLGLADSFGGTSAYYARLRKIAPDGTITTVAGPGGKLYTDPLADDALVLPAGITFGPDGRMSIIDTGANQVRILPPGSF